MNTSSNRLWALAGPLAVVLWVAGIALINHDAPGEHATGSQILAWYRSDSDSVVLGGWLFMLGCLGFVSLAILAFANGPRAGGLAFAALSLLAFGQTCLDWRKDRRLRQAKVSPPASAP